MLKTLIPSLVLAGAFMTTSAQAADGDKLLGFEFGVGYHLVDDSNYEGVSTNFGLVIPVGQKFDVVIYHEAGSYHGKQDDDKSNAESDVNESICVADELTVVEATVAMLVPSLADSESDNKIL